MLQRRFWMRAWSPYPAYGAILVLLGAQVWDLWLYHLCAPKAALDMQVQEPSTQPVDLPAGRR
ncbi:MAG TPA: hypothetical protein VJO32_16745 [Ktedonobacteraceae bacterium]|nr:hypothetical protein [Ktedonobacteraceae bacterium]